MSIRIYLFDTGDGEGEIFLNLLLESFHIKKYYGERLIFELPDFKIYAGDKIGIVGPNGAGKTTLLNILSGDVLPDEGTCKQYCEIAYIKQFSNEVATGDASMMRAFSLNGKTNRENVSGGEQTRIKIANAISQNPVLLFADEPTSNLDYKGIGLLREKLSAVDTFVLISHDRDLLDGLCNKIVEIREGTIHFYHGNYSFYVEQAEAKMKRANFEYEQYSNEKARLELAISNTKQKAKSIQKTPKRMGNSEARLHKRSSTEIEQQLNNATNAMKTRLSRLEIKEKQKEIPKIKIDFSLTNPPENKILLSGKHIHFSYGNGENVIFEDGKFDIYNNTKTAIIGENGAGKTTLLNLLANKNENVYIVPKVKLGYFYQRFENLDFEKTVLENAMMDSIQNQTTVRTVLARLLFKGEDVFKKVSVLSGGEKIKLSLAKLLTSDKNILMLDEPTNYLDISSIEAVQELLLEYEGTLIFVSHDKSFVDAVANKLLIIEEKNIKSFDGNLSAYENRNKKGSTLKDENNKLLLEMKLTRILSAMSMKDADKEALELEYQEIIKLMK